MFHECEIYSRNDNSQNASNSHWNLVSNSYLKYFSNFLLQLVVKKLRRKPFLDVVTDHI